MVAIETSWILNPNCTYVYSNNQRGVINKLFELNGPNEKNWWITPLGIKLDFVLEEPEMQAGNSTTPRSTITVVIPTKVD